MVNLKLNKMCVLLFIIVLVVNNIGACTNQKLILNDKFVETSENMTEEEVETDQIGKNEEDPDLQMIERIRKEYSSLEYKQIASLSQFVFRAKKTDNYVVDRTFGPINNVEIEQNDEKRKKKLSLTFDCAFAGDYVIPILDVLDEYDIKASFFSTMGFIKAYPDYVIEIIKRGHDFGNHSTNHLHLNLEDDETVIREVIETEVYVKKTFGVDMCLYRGPYGEFNERNIELVKKMGYYNTNWRFDSLDWENRGAEHIVQRVLDHKFYQGTIMLFHVSGIYTAGTLPSIIQYLRLQGFDFVKLTDLIYEDDFIVEKGMQKKIIDKSIIDE